MRLASRLSLKSSSTALTFEDALEEQADEHPGGEDAPMWVCRFGAETRGRWGQHFHRQHQLAWVSEGAMSVQIGDEAWAVPTNRAVWLPSGYRHDVVTRAGSTLHCLYVWPDACPVTWSRPTLVEISPVVRELILLLTEHCDESPVSEAAGTLLFSLLEPSVGNPVRLPLPRDPQALAIAEELLARPRETLRLDQWARRHHLSVSTLRRRFVDETGLTFSEWRRQARLHASLQLLADGMTVESVAAGVGYASANGYIDAFKRHFGATPTQHAGRGRKA